MAETGSGRILKMQLNVFSSISVTDKIRTILKELGNYSDSSKMEIINSIRLELHRHSPLASEPVDCVQWVPAELVKANDYNPNTVAPVEMQLLECSVLEDGYTQPIVTWKNNGFYEVVDGFHRNRVGKECEAVRTRIKGFLPVVVVNDDRLERGDRIASTIRHNRARGKHRIDAMSDIVVELKRRNWSNERITRELGMEPDEILRLMQITGLSELFSDGEFSKSWDVESFEDDFEMLDGDLDQEEFEGEGFRATNTNDPTRIFHIWEKWECHKAGLYATTKAGMTKKECEEAYRDFLSDTERFSLALHHVITEWKFSCEHYLTNVSMNRIAWLGQASMCYSTGIPACFRTGFYLLSEEQQNTANQTALIYLNKWLEANNREALTLEQAMSGDRQVDIY